MNALTDFNDLATAEGLEAVAQIVSHPVPVIDPPVWPEPMIPGTLRTPDFPEDILRGVWGDMARAVSASTQTPPALSVMCVLGVMATTMQRRFEVSPYGDGYVEPLPLWITIASPSGSRKTAVQNAIDAPLTKWEKLQYDRYRVLIARTNAARSTAKKRIEALNQQATKCKDATELQTIRDAIEHEELDMPEEARAPRLRTGDCTPERLQALLFENSERMSIHSDEPGIFRMISGGPSGGNPNYDVFLQGHAGSSMRIDRAGRMAHVDKPALTLSLMIQNDMLSEVAGSKGLRDSGLMARILFAVPATNVGKRDVRKHSSIDAGVRDRYERGVMSLLEGWLCEPGTVPAVRVLNLADPARELWLDFSQYIEDRQGDGCEFESIRDWSSKLPGAVARIAALLELAEVGLLAEPVSSDAMDRAIRLGKVLIPHAQCAFGLLGTDAIDADAQAVLKWIQRKGECEFKRNEAHRAMQGRFTSIDKLKKALERLDSMDCVREFKRSNPKAKESIWYRVNPALL